MFAQPSLKPGLLTRLCRWQPGGGRVLALLALTAAVAAGAGLGIGLSLNRPAAQMVDRIATLKEQSRRQQAEVERLGRESDHRLQTLAVRLSELRAEATRINALGQRLVQMGQLDAAEFDFGMPPPLGGPDPSIDSAADSIADVELEATQLGHRLQRQQAQLDALADLLTRRQLEDQYTPAGWPVSQGWISSSFGRRTDPFSGRRAHHSGVDFAGPRGAEVRAVAAGVVVWAGPRYGYGKAVDVDHGNGYVTRYAHNDRLEVRVGQRVKAGQVIGAMGDTGRATAPHLHFEVLLDGRAVNPWDYIHAGKNGGDTSEERG